MSLRPTSAPVGAPTERKTRLEQVLWAGLRVDAAPFEPLVRGIQTGTAGEFNQKYSPDSRRQFLKPLFKIPLSIMSSGDTATDYLRVGEGHDINEAGLWKRKHTTYFYPAGHPKIRVYVRSQEVDEGFVHFMAVAKSKAEYGMEWEVVDDEDAIEDEQDESEELTKTMAKWREANAWLTDWEKYGFKQGKWTVFNDFSVTTKQDTIRAGGSSLVVYTTLRPGQVKPAGSIQAMPLLFFGELSQIETRMWNEAFRVGLPWTPRRYIKDDPTETPVFYRIWQRNDLRVYLKPAKPEITLRNITPWRVREAWEESQRLPSIQSRLAHEKTLPGSFDEPSRVQLVEKADWPKFDALWAAFGAEYDALVKAAMAEADVLTKYTEKMEALQRGDGSEHDWYAALKAAEKSLKYSYLNVGGVSDTLDAVEKDLEKLKADVDANPVPKVETMPTDDRVYKDAVRAHSRFDRNVFPEARETISRIQKAVEEAKKSLTPEELAKMEKRAARAKERDAAAAKAAVAAAAAAVAAAAAAAAVAAASAATVRAASKLAAAAKKKATAAKKAKATAFAAEMAAKGADLVVLADANQYVNVKGRSTVLLRPSGEGARKSMRKLFASMDPHTLGKKGKTMHSFKGLKPLEVFDVDYTHKLGTSDAYYGMRAAMRDHLNASVECGDPIARRVCARTDQVFGPGTDGITPPLDPRVNEKVLMHGTSIDTTKTILTGGFSDRFGEAEAYGPGIYFAEDVAKNDQYAMSERGNKFVVDELGIDPNKNVYLLLVARVTLGCTVHTGGGSFGLGADYYGVNCRDLDNERVFVTYPGNPRHTMRPGADALIAEHGSVVGGDKNSAKGKYPGAVYREFIIPDNAQTMPAYLVVVERTMTPPTVDFKQLDCAPDAVMRGARVVFRSHNVWWKNADLRALSNSLLDTESYDFCAIQEGTDTLFMLLETALAHSRNSETPRKLLYDKPCGNNTAYAALLYNSYRFTPVGAPYFGCFRLKDGTLEKGRPMVGAVFRDGFSARLFVVAAIHAPHNKSKPFSLRKNLEHVIIEAIKASGTKDKVQHVLIAGDFNEREWHDNTRQGIFKQTLQMGKPTKFDLRSAQGHAGKSTLYSTHPKEGAIDNVLYGSLAGGVSLKLSDFSRDSEKYGSDHNPVEARFQLK